MQLLCEHGVSIPTIAKNVTYISIKIKINLNFHINSVYLIEKMWYNIINMCRINLTHKNE